MSSEQHISIIAQMLHYRVSLDRGIYLRVIE